MGRRDEPDDDGEEAMPYARSGDVKLYYEDTGSGPPVVFAHELGSDIRQWRGQVARLAPRLRCIAFNARGYPPSDVPDADEAYLWDRFAGDIGAVLDHLGLERAALVGWSMGAYAALQFARLRPERVAAVAAVGVGSGSPGPDLEPWRAQMRELAIAWRDDPGRAAETFAASPNREAFARRDPDGFARWLADLKTHSPLGMARTCANYQGRRPSLEDFGSGFASLPMPVLIMVGEEDQPCLEASAWLARTIPGARLERFAGCGHCPNLEAPDAFNLMLEEFLSSL
jgi:pimeloyl-ACP methyl ester carboxylesterase